MTKEQAITLYKIDKQCLEVTYKLKTLLKTRNDYIELIKKEENKNASTTITM